MNERDDELEDLFRERFSEKEAPVSPRVWNNIKNSLPPENDKKVFWKKPKNLFGIIIGGLVAGITLWWTLSTDPRKEDLTLTEKLAIESTKSENREKLGNNTDEINRSENQKGEEVKISPNNNTTSTNGEYKENGSTKKSTISSDAKNEQSGNKESKAKTNSTISVIERSHKERGNDPIIGSEKELTSKGNRLNNSGGKGKKEQVTTAGIINEQTGNKNKSSQKTSYFSKENEQASKNLAVSESAQKDNVGTTGTDENKKDSDQPATNKVEARNNRSISESAQKDNVGTTGTDENKKDSDQPTTNKVEDSNNNSISENSQEDKVGVNGTDGNKNDSDQSTSNQELNGNNPLVSGVNQDLKEENSSQENSGPKEEGKNKTDLSQNNSREQNKERMQDPSLAALKENEKLHDLSRDSSVSSSQKEHAPADKSKVSNNSETGNEKVAADSIVNTPVISKATLDSIQPVVDTLTNVKVDSTTNADSTTKKEKEKLPKASRWSVDLVLGPMLTGASTQANDLAYQDRVDAKNQQDKSQLNFSAGGMVNYSVVPGFFISTGLMYSGYSEKYNFKNTKDSLVLGSHVEYDSIQTGQDTTGPIYTLIERTVIDTNGVVSNEYSDKKKDQYSFISVPLNMSMYLWRREKLAVLATAGIRANLIMKNTTYITNSGMTALTEYSGGVQKLTLSYMASVALEYQLRKKMYLLVQPTVNYQAGSIYTKSSVLNQKPYSVGVNVGLRIKF